MQNYEFFPNIPNFPIKKKAYATIESYTLRVLLSPFSAVGVVGLSIYECRQTIL